MKIYLATFLLAILIIKFSELITNSFLKKMVLILAITFPATLAGMRSINVGTDILYYGLAAYKMSFVSDLAGILNHYRLIGDNSTIFYTLWYYSSRLSKSLFGPQFILEFLIELNIIFALTKFSQSISKYRLWQGMAVYYFIFYSYSLNIMKQSLAMSMIFVIFLYLLMENKEVKYMIGVLLIGLFVHTSALIALFVVPIKHIWERVLKHKRSTFIFKVGIFCFPLMVVFLYKPIIMIVSKIFPRYALYLSSAYASGISMKGTMTQVVMLLAIYFVIVFIKNSLSTKVNDIGLYESLYLLGISLFNFSLVARNGYRIGLYFAYIGILLVTTVFNNGNVKIDSDNSIVMIFRSILLLLVLILFWYVSFVLMGINQVVPYSLG